MGHGRELSEAGHGRLLGRRRRPGTAAVPLVAAFLLTGCSDGADDVADRSDTTVDSTAGQDGASSSSDGSATTDDGAATTRVPDDGAEGVEQPQLPEGALGEQAQWVLDQLAPDATPTTSEEAQERFSADFLDAVPADQIEPVFAQLRSAEPVTLVDVTEQAGTGDGSGSAMLRVAGSEPLVITISVDADDRISGLLLQPDTTADVPNVSSWEDLDAGFAELGATTQVYAADVTGGTCTPVHETPESQAAPSGSVFKLIVLSAVVDAVTDGDLAWDDELTITPEAKSLPSGELQDREDGSKVTVQEAAELMIGISDNTATDLLMDAVGAERIETAVNGISTEPERLTPLLSTQQFFLLGWGAPEVRAQWADADPTARADLLEELPEDVSGLNPVAVNGPAWTDGVGWFLTGAEICAAHAELQEQAQTEAGAPVREILSGNPGLVPPSGTTYQGFKGGSAPGVLALTFYQEGEAAASGNDVSGRVLVVQVRHEGTILDQPFAELTQAGLALLAAG